MKAVICTGYGPPDVLQLREVDKPVPKSDELLIKVHTSAVHSGDRRLRALDVPALGKLPMRVIVGFKAPRQPILGVVLAGEIVETGSRVEDFKVGDRVYALTGMRFGGYAEYACVKANKCIERMPTNASFIEAASLPFGGTTALHFLRKVNIEQAKTILIYGASGAVGSMAVQIAKYYGAHVTAVCRERNFELVKSLGADIVIDYTIDGYDEKLTTYDTVFDAAGNIDKRLARKHVAEHGKFSSVAGQGPASERKEDLTFLKELFEAGQLKAVIDSVYPLEDIVAAHRYVDAGGKAGNVIMTVAQAN
ncbi:NAD(P)-dependent alcohol dehydrogenase [Exiguobacterium aurantiacum]|uniref:NAD(P)-dependent alcohol dehydrogenase n=1 Tax=Exiguobacterium aurantiacum TaxID=33987 RepID=A0ABY5FK46_9BACL|nr:NAD(P)-dependent alcohol dehydrogenase [Exiguobacterium aurantiacum]UTT41613.1 NAD(P)-dependent alcohol dehydrogenase [Exiguobacterium aurantiacum]